MSNNVVKTAIYRSEPLTRRDQIIAAAMELMAAKGFYAVTVRDIAEACNLTKAGLLHHFAAKEDLLIAVLNERESRQTLRLKREAPADLSGQELIIHNLRAAVFQSLERPSEMKLFMVLRVEALDERHPAYQYFRDHDRNIARILTKALGRFYANSEELSRQLLAMMMGLEYYWIRADYSFDLVGEWEKSMAALLNCAGATKKGAQ